MATTHDDLAEDAARQEHDEREAFAVKVERMFPNLNGKERLEFLGWFMKQATVVEKMSLSTARVNVLHALGYCPDYKIDQDRDAENLDAIIERVVAPADWPGWGPAGRRGSLKNIVYRMTQAGLLRSEEGSLHLTGAGAVYIHQKRRFPGSDLADFWKCEMGLATAPAATNPFYLAFMGEMEAPPEAYRFDTPGSSVFSSLKDLYSDSDIYNRYMGNQKTRDNKRLADLKTILHAIHENELSECFKFLDDVDRRRLIRDVVRSSGTTNPGSVRRETNHVDSGAYAARIDKLRDVWLDAHPLSEDEPDPDDVIGELIVRTAWVVLSRLMGHRMNDDYDPTPDTLTERYLRGDHEAIEEVSELFVIVPMEDFYEPDEDIARGR
jgi:hypothetical protein